MVVTGSPPREINNNKKKKRSPEKKQSNSSGPALNIEGLQTQPAFTDSVDRTASRIPIETIAVDNQVATENPDTSGQGLQEVVKKFSQDKKSSRQVKLPYSLF